MSPWKEIDKVTRMLLEAGLIDHYKFKEFLETRRRFLESDEEKIIYVEPPVVAPMNMEDLQIIFFLWGLCLSFCLITFLTEFLLRSVKSRKKVIPTI